MGERGNWRRLCGAAAAASGVLVGLASGVAARPTLAADGWPAVPNAAQAGAFGVLQMTTTDPKGFLADWAKPGVGAHMKGVTRARRGQQIVTFLSFRGCSADARGECNVVAQYQVTGPDGQSWASTTLPVRVKRPALRPMRVGMATQGFAMTIDGAQAAGVYRVAVTTTDLVAHISLHTVQAVTVSP